MKRVLIHGFGSIGQRHLRVIRALQPELELAVLSEHGGHAQAAEAPGRLFTARAEAEAFRPDVVVIANAAVGHLPAALAWLRAGAHLLVEKPLATGSDGVVALAALACERGRVVQVGYNLRQAPSLQVMRQLCDAGRLGRVLGARVEVGQHLASWRAGDPLRTVSAQRALGGGVLLELSHEIDYLQWLLGPVEWVAATLLRQGPWDIDVEDTALLTLGLAGPQACVASMQLDFVRHDTTRRCTVLGLEGSLQWDAVARRLSLYRSGASGWETVVEDAAERDATYRAQWQAFMQSCRTGAAPAVTIEDGGRVLRVVEAARRSSELQGQRVPVQPGSAA